MTEVWILQHVSHAIFRDGTFNPHVDEDGQLWWDEEAGDDIKLLGVYSGQAQGLAAIERARQQPGFREEPNCFMLLPHEIDGSDAWADGFIRHLPDGSAAPFPEDWKRLAATVEVMTT